MNSNTSRAVDKAEEEPKCPSGRFGEEEDKRECISPNIWNLFVICAAALALQPSLVSGASLEETAKMDSAEVLKYYGYPAETHRVQTIDGYILTLHRIPNKKSKRPPVLIMHGILDSSFTWLLTGPQTALGFKLFDSGYDVWLGNFRGNVYSQSHNWLSTDQDEYWDFSWDEMGKRDLPAMVDYVLHRTGRPKLFHIGHSMGTTTFFVLTSSMPSYNKKFVAHFSLSPVGYWGNSASFFWKILAPVEMALSEFMHKTNHGGFLVDQDAESIRDFCTMNPSTERLCKLFLHCSFGFSNVLRNETIYNVVTAHIPAGTSVKAFNHYTQLMKSGRFCNYDSHDMKRNYLRYGTARPPEYNVSAITVPVQFYYAANDAVSVPVDVIKLYTQLRNPIGLHLVQDTLFNHIDFTIDPKAYKLIYRKMIKMMNSLSL
ncbi:unnamed protein product [Bemisia tabaci]|uniref:Lipase n=2 Tax=Bemisia tabaci TaxID=7038 RepID=A0A9P0ABQ0_BEMTA|nr:unnamed protein product [Bemisia tabaci]